MTDDQEDTGSMAYMPKTLSLIADEGVTFKNSLVNLPLCAPSRASFLTGQAAHSHGIRANSPLDQGGWEAFKSKEENALPVWLKAAGYKTALIGKYLNRYGQQSAYGAWLAWLGSWINVEFKGTTVGNPRDWVPPGWDLWYAFTGTRVRYYDYSINENGKILSFDHASKRLFDRRARRARRPLHQDRRKARLRSSCSSRLRPCTRKGPAPFRRRNMSRPSTTFTCRRTPPSTNAMCTARRSRLRASASSTKQDLELSYRAELRRFNRSTISSPPWSMR